MPVASSDFPTSLLTNHMKLFERDFRAAEALNGAMSFTTRISTKKKITTLHWFGTTPQMVDTSTGPLILDSLDKFSLSITTRTYKTGIEILREAVEDDDLGLISPRVTQLAQEAARHQNQLILELPEDTTITGFDGTAFFSDTRTIGESANIDNQVETASAGAVPTVGEVHEIVREVDATMMKFQDEKGRVMGHRPDLWMVPPEVAQVYFQALVLGQALATVAATDVVVAPTMPMTMNGVIPLGGGRSMYINPLLTDVNDVYAYHTGGAGKPFIFVEQVRPALESLKAGSDIWTLEDKLVEVVRGRYYIGKGDPRDAIQVVDTGS